MARSDALQIVMERSSRKRRVRRMREVLESDVHPCNTLGAEGSVLVSHLLKLPYDVLS